MNLRNCESFQDILQEFTKDEFISATLVRKPYVTLHLNLISRSVTWK